MLSPAATASAGAAQRSSCCLTERRLRRSASAWVTSASMARVQRSSFWLGSSAEKSIRSSSMIFLQGRTPAQCDAHELARPKKLLAGAHLGNAQRGGDFRVCPALEIVQQYHFTL